MPASLRVLHVGKFYPPYRGGMEVFLADLVNAQRCQGLEAAVLVHGTPQADDPAWLVRVPVQFTLLYAPIALGFRAALARAIRQFKPDLLHLHLPNNSALWVLTLPQARAIPWVVHWHSDVVLSNIKWSVAAAYALYRPFEQAVLDGAERIIATSPPYLQASEPLRRWHGKCAVVALGLRTDLLPPPADLAATASTAAAAPGIASPLATWSPGARLRLLSIGRLTYYKGFETLIEAVQQLPGVELLVAGEGELQAALQARIATAARHAVPGALPARLLGNVSEAHKHALLAGCDVFCLASRERTEAFGVVLLEAMHHARACIVTDLPGSGMPWVVAQSRAGLCVPIEDVPAWRSAITRLQHDVPLRHRLGNAGPEALARSFGIAACARAVQRQYHAIVPASAAMSMAHPGAGTRPALVVLPIRNQAHCIGPLVRALQAQGGCEVLVIDDRSTDGTCHAAQAAGARVLRPLLAQNAWSALQTGMRHALAHGHAGVLTLETTTLARTDAGHVARLLAHARQTQADVVLGVAAHTRRRPRLAAAWFRRLAGLGLSDVGTGFRHYNRRALAVLAAREATLLDYADLGSLLLARRAGLGISEIALPQGANVANLPPMPDLPPPAAFATWTGTVRYLAATTLLCLARWPLPGQRRSIR